jgi:hypothetical protein
LSLERDFVGSLVVVEIQYERAPFRIHSSRLVYAAIISYHLRPLISLLRKATTSRERWTFAKHALIRMSEERAQEHRDLGKQGIESLTLF